MDQELDFLPSPSKPEQALIQEMHQGFQRWRQLRPDKFNHNLYSYFLFKGPAMSGEKKLALTAFSLIPLFLGAVASGASDNMLRIMLAGAAGVLLTAVTFFIKSLHRAYHGPAYLAYPLQLVDSSLAHLHTHHPALAQVQQDFFLAALEELKDLPPGQERTALEDRFLAQATSLSYLVDEEKALMRKREEEAKFSFEETHGELLAGRGEAPALSAYRRDVAESALIQNELAAEKSQG